MPESQQFTCTARLPVPPAIAWRYWVNTRQRNQWWPGVELEVKPGGRFLEKWRNADNRIMKTTGKVKEAVKPNRLVFDWKEADWPASTCVTITLKPTETGTRLILQQRGFENLPPPVAEKWKTDLQSGWRSLLKALKTIAGKSAKAGNSGQ